MTVTIVTGGEAFSAPGSNQEQLISDHISQGEHSPKYKEEGKMLALYMWVRNWLKAQEGQDLIEYALLVAFIALVAVVGVNAAGEGISTMMTNVADAVSGVAVSLP
jgi:Flp pilus assembly pilin Flp